MHSQYYCCLSHKPPFLLLCILSNVMRWDIIQCDCCCELMIYIALIYNSNCYIIQIHSFQRHPYHYHNRYHCMRLFSSIDNNGRLAYLLLNSTELIAKNSIFGFTVCSMYKMHYIRIGINFEYNDIV